MALHKVMNQQTISKSNHAEALLWISFVMYIYLCNKLRVLKNYRINKNESKGKRDQKNNDGFDSRPGSIVNFRAFLPDFEEKYDKTEIAVS